MLFSSRAPLGDMVELCRVLRHSLGAGVPLLRIWRQQAERGPRSLRGVSRRVHDRLEQGETLHAALAPEEKHFPDLFVTLISVGEQTGQTPEIAGQLEEHYREQQQLWRQFATKMVGPVFMLIVALGVIALLIYVLGWIQAARGSSPVSVAGLRGASGALIFLGLALGLFVGSVLLFHGLRRFCRARPEFDRFLLRLPGLGPYLLVQALGRFSMTLQLGLETGMDVIRVVRLGLEATGNGAFMACAEPVAKALLEGERLTAALTPTGLFPEDYLYILTVAEESGSIPEMMKRQSRQQFEEGSRRLAWLLRLLAGLGWLIYAGFMIAAIFTLANVYLSQLPR